VCKALPTAACSTPSRGRGDAIDHRNAARGFWEAQVAHTFANDARESDGGRPSTAERYRGGLGTAAPDPGYELQLPRNWGTAELPLSASRPMAGHRLFVGGEIQDGFASTCARSLSRQADLRQQRGQSRRCSGRRGDSTARTPATTGRHLAAALLDQQSRAHRTDYADFVRGAVVKPRVALIAPALCGRHHQVALPAAPFRAPGIYERFFKRRRRLAESTAQDLRARAGGRTFEVEHTHQREATRCRCSSRATSAASRKAESARRRRALGGRERQPCQASSREPGGGSCTAPGPRPRCLGRPSGSAVLRLVRLEPGAGRHRGPGGFQGAPIANSPRHSGALRLLYPISCRRCFRSRTEAVYGGPRHHPSPTRSEPDRLVGESLSVETPASRGEYARWKPPLWSVRLRPARPSASLLPGGFPEIPFPGHAVPQIGRHAAASSCGLLLDAASRRQRRSRRPHWGMPEVWRSVEGGAPGQDGRPRRAARPSWVFSRAPARCCSHAGARWAMRSAMKWIASFPENRGARAPRPPPASICCETTRETGAPASSARRGSDHHAAGTGAVAAVAAGCWRVPGPGSPRSSGPGRVGAAALQALRHTLPGDPDRPSLGAAGRDRQAVREGTRRGKQRRRPRRQSEART